jgi:hypothetical protein
MNFADSESARFQRLSASIGRFSTSSPRQQFSLGVGRPYDVARPVAVPEARTVKNDDPVILGSKIDQAAGFKILYHAAVAVQKHQRSTLIKELTGGRIIMLRLPRKMAIDQSRHR